MLVFLRSDHAVIIQDFCYLCISHFLIHKQFKHTLHYRGSIWIGYDMVFIQRITHKPICKVPADIAPFFPMRAVRRLDFFRQIP